MDLITVNPKLDARIPRHSLAGLRRYILDRVPTGHFLAAVLANDLMEACARGDADNLAALPDICRWLYNCAPMGCYGSPAHYRAWLDGHPLAPEGDR